MARDILPFLSGTLEAVIEEMAQKGDIIAKEIYRINQLVNQAMNIQSFLSNTLKAAILEKVIGTELTGEVSMISVRTGSDDANVSFLPKDKEPEYTENGTWARRNRQEGKPGKIFQKALVAQFKTREWEIFTNNFKSAVCDCNNFELVSGEDIRKWYWDKNYYECKGTLGNSCMRYENAQEFFDIYVDNAKMLITKKAGRLTGRAIVWEIDENTTILDRIYTCFDYLENCFIEYAKEHKWIIRDNNSLLHTGEVQCWRTPDDDYASSKPIDFTIKLKRHYSMFPYVDSFRYYNIDRNEITTEISDAALDSTDGDYSGCSVSCDNCGRVFYGYTEDDDLPDELHWCEWTSSYLCDDCCYWSNYLDEYAPYSVANAIIHEYSWGATDRVPLEIIQENLASNPEELQNMDNPIVEIGGEYYLYENYCQQIIYNLDKNCYEIRSNS